jgi:sacsin
MRSLQTRLCVKATGDDVTRDPSSLCFVDEETAKIYIQDGTGIRLAHAVAVAIQQRLALRDTAPILAMLDTDDIPRTLKWLGVSCRKDVNAVDLEWQRRGVPGNELLPMDIDALELKPLRSYVVGEIVAIEHRKTSHGCTYTYAIVTDEGMMNSHSISRVKHIQVISRPDQEPHWLPSSHVFSFRSSRVTGTSTHEEGEDNHLVRDDNVIHPAAAIASVTGPRPSVLLSSHHSHDRSYSNNSSVPEVHVVAAVNDLLSRLNLNLSAPYEALIQETVALKQRLRDAEEGCRGAAERIADALRQKREVLEAMICSICLEHDVNRVLIPCGHVYCQACVAQFRDHKCPMCRHPFTSSCTFHKPC